MDNNGLIIKQPQPQQQQQQQQLTQDHRDQQQQEYPLNVSIDTIDKTVNTENSLDDSSKMETDTLDEKNDKQEGEEGELSEDDEDDFVEEPLLNYQRVGGSLSGLLESRSSTSLLSTVSSSSSVKDKVSCLVVHEKYLLVGTFSGSVIQFGFDGSLLRRYGLHKDKVLGLSVDSDGSIFASCSNDGKVIAYENSINKVNHHETNNKPVVHSFYHAVHAVQLDPSFNRIREKVFVCGVGGRLVLRKKGWFSSNDTVIHKGEGMISQISWRSRFIAWTNDTGVKIYDYIQEQRIAFIERPDGSPPADRCGCSMVWEDPKTLFIAWADRVKIVQIRERTKEELLEDPTALPRCAEFVYLYEFPGLYICGIAPFGGEHLVLLTYLLEHEEGDQNARNPPELRVIKRTNGEDVSIEELPIYGFEENNVSDYFLESNHELVRSFDGKPILYIVSPKDVVVARPRNTEDHITWALGIGDFERALKLGEKAIHDRDLAIKKGKSIAEVEAVGLRNHTIRGLQDKMLGNLLNEGEFKRAASLCPRLIDSDSDRWIQWATKFQNYQKLYILAGYLPIRNPQLPAVVYESTLFEMLDLKYYQEFLAIVRQWQTLLYNHAKAELYLKGMDAILDDQTNVDTTEMTSVANSLLNVTNSATQSDEELSQQRELIKIYPLYNVKAVIERLNKTICELGPSATPPSLRDALAELYAADGQYNMALREYLQSATLADQGSNRAGYIFAMIERHGLLASVQDKIQSLVNLDMDRAISLLIASVSQNLGLEDESIARKQILDIVCQLGGHEDGSLDFSKSLLPLHKFLHKLSTQRQEEYNQSSMGIFQDMQVHLYAKYQPESLSEFLESSNYYSLDGALKVCEEIKPKPLYKDIVFILGKLGGYENTQRALKIIVDKLRNVEHAIEFVERESTFELWNDLISRCSKNPALVGGLLQSAGAHNVDPIGIIKAIPDDMQVEGLCLKLTKLYDDIKVQLRLRTGCNDILKSDVSNLFQNLYRRRKRAVRVVCPNSPMDKGKGNGFCGICLRALQVRVESSSQQQGNDEISETSTEFTPQIIVFGSGATYHFDCIETTANKLPMEDVLDESYSVNELKKLYLRHAMIFAKQKVTGSDTM